MNQPIIFPNPPCPYKNHHFARSLSVISTEGRNLFPANSTPSQDQDSSLRYS